MTNPKPNTAGLRQNTKKPRTVFTLYQIYNEKGRCRKRSEKRYTTTTEHNNNEGLYGGADYHYCYLCKKRRTKAHICSVCQQQKGTRSVYSDTYLHYRQKKLVNTPLLALTRSKR